MGWTPPEWARRQVCAVLLMITVGAATAAHTDEHDLGAHPPLLIYLRIAERESPAIEAARLRWQAARERIPQAGAWPDPTLRYRYFVEEVETALGPQKQSLGLAQPVPFPGKLPLRSERAALAARAAWTRYLAERLAVFERVARAYYEYAYLARALEINAENLTLLEGVEEVIRTRYTTGQAAQAELLRLQVEVGTVEDQLLSLKSRRAPLRRRLNAALGRSARAPLPWPIPLLDPAEELPEDVVLLGEVRTANPELRALELEAEEAERSLALARRDALPDVTVGVETIRTDRSNLNTFADRGKDAWILSVSLPLPVFFSKFGAAVREADAQRRGKRVELQRRELRMLSEAEERLFELHDAERRMRLYRTSLIPLGEQALESTLTAFETGAGSFFDTLDAQRVLLRFRLDLARARADRGASAAALATLAGRTPAELPEPEEEPR